MAAYIVLGMEIPLIKLFVAIDIRRRGNMRELS
jgi:hypothetical protein